MSSRKKKGNTHNKTRTNKKKAVEPKTIDDHLNGNIFPIRSNEYITIELETCNEGNENPIYNYN